MQPINPQDSPQEQLDTVTQNLIEEILKPQESLARRRYTRPAQERALDKLCSGFPEDMTPEEEEAYNLWLDQQADESEAWRGR